MSSWKFGRPKQLKKIVFSMTESTLEKLIKSHEIRGWTQASEVKPHGYGVGCLMIWKNDKLEGVKSHASNSKSQF